MGSLDSKVFLRVGDRTALVPAPDQGLTMSPVSWGTSTQLVNGGNTVVASEYASRTFNLSWTVLSARDLEVIEGMLAYAGTKPVHYLDRFAASGNILSPLASRPYLLYETLSPLAFDTKGVRLCDRGAGDSLKFLPVSATDGKEHSYTEKVQVPLGYRATVLCTGTNTERVLSFNGVAVQPGRATSVSATSGNVEAHLTYRCSGVQAEVSNCTVVLSPAAKSAPSPRWSLHRGTTVMCVVPGTYAVTGRSAVNDLYSVSVDLMEVWPWR